MPYTFLESTNIIQECDVIGFLVTWGSLPCRSFQDPVPYYQVGEGRRERKRNSLWIYASAGGTNKFPGTEKTNFSAAGGTPTSDVVETNNAFLEEYRIKTFIV